MSRCLWDWFPAVSVSEWRREPNRSLILERMQLKDLGRMPHIASKVVDQAAMNLIRQWVASLSDETLLDAAGALHPRLPGL